MIKKTLLYESEPEISYYSMVPVNKSSACQDKVVIFFTYHGDMIQHRWTSSLKAFRR